jgi:hypothetical protein
LSRFVKQASRLKKRSQLFIRVHNKALSVVAVRVRNPDRSPLGIHGSTQPQLQPALLRLSAIIPPAPFHAARFCLFCSLHGNAKNGFLRKRRKKHGKTYTRTINGMAMTERSPYSLDSVQLEKAVHALQKAAETLRPKPREERLYRFLGICVRVAVAAFAGMVLFGVMFFGLMGKTPETATAPVVVFGIVTLCFFLLFFLLFLLAAIGGPRISPAEPVSYQTGVPSTAALEETRD